MAVGAAQGINRLVRGDSVKPRAHRTARLVLAFLDIQLQERVLEHILSQITIAQVPAQITVQLTFIAAQQNPKRFRLTTAKARQ